MVVAEHPLLQFARVSGRDAQGVDARPLGSIHNVSITFDAGVHAFVGRPSDGTVALCALAGGRRAPSIGIVTMFGREPHKSASMRRRAGVSLPRAALNGRRTVADALAFMGAARGAELSHCLDAFGAAPLASRTLRSLDADEARAVELAALLSLPELVVLAAYEPLAIGALDQGVVRARLAALGARGACVIVATAAPEALGALPRHVYLLEKGRLWGRDEEVGWTVRPIDPAHPPSTRGQPESMSLWLRETDARRLASALSERGEVEAVRWVMHPGGLAEVVAAGVDLERLALCIAETVTQLQVDVSAMSAAETSIEGMRAAARAHVEATRGPTQPGVTQPVLTQSGGAPP